MTTSATVTPIRRAIDQQALLLGAISTPVRVLVDGSADYRAARRHLVGWVAKRTLMQCSRSEAAQRLGLNPSNISRAWARAQATPLRNVFHDRAVESIARELADRRLALCAISKIFQLAMVQTALHVERGCVAGAARRLGLTRNGLNLICKREGLKKK